MKFRVIKNKLRGYSVERNGEILSSIFTLKKDATRHMNNLKKVANAIEQKLNQNI